MISRPLFSVIAACVCLCFSCIKPDPVISVNSEEIAVPSEGGTVNVGYNIDNPIEEAIVGVEINVNWLKISNITSQGIFLYAEPNFLKDRQTEVIIHYPEAISKSVFLSQGVNDPVKIRIDELGATSAVGKIIPNSSKLVYFWNVIADYEYECFKNDDDIIYNTFEFCRFVASTEGKSFKNVMNELKTTGVENIVVDKLTPSSTYYVIAFGLSDDLISANTRLVSLKFITESE